MSIARFTELTEKGNYKDHTFHDEQTGVDSGTDLEVTPAFTSLLIEVYGTSSSRTLQFKAKGESGTARTLLGTKISDASTATSTTGTAELWRFDITGLKHITMDLTAVAGGNVSVKGRAVA